MTFIIGGMSALVDGGAFGGELEGGSGFAGAVFQEACAIGFQGEGDGKVVVVEEEEESFSVFVPFCDFHAFTGWVYGGDILFVQYMLQEICIKIFVGSGGYVVGVSFSVGVGGEHGGPCVEVAVVNGEGLRCFHVHDVADNSGFVGFSVPGEAVLHIGGEGVCLFYPNQLNCSKWSI